MEANTSNPLSSLPASPSQQTIPPIPTTAIPITPVSPQAPLAPGQLFAPQYPVQIAHAKPPLSVQIYYVLSLLGMALALAAIVIIGFLAAQLQTQASVGLEVGTLLLLITGAATAIGQFYLTHEMRKGKRWALISNTVLLGIILCTEAYGAFQQGDYRVSYSIISIVFFVLFWTKDRAYFK